MKSKKIVALFSVVSFSVLPVMALACDIDAGATEWFNCILTNILNDFVWPIFFGLSILMFIWAGILFVTAQGDPGKIATAKKAVLWAIIGIMVAIIGFSAYSIISGTLGV